jgi:hypothetical protein
MPQRQPSDDKDKRKRRVFSFYAMRIFLFFFFFSPRLLATTRDCRRPEGLFRGTILQTAGIDADAKIYMVELHHQGVRRWGKMIANQRVRQEKNLFDQTMIVLVQNWIARNAMFFRVLHNSSFRSQTGQIQRNSFFFCGMC